MQYDSEHALRRRAKEIAELADREGRDFTEDEASELDDILARLDGKARERRGHELEKLFSDGPADDVPRSMRGQHQAHPWRRAMENRAGGLKDLAPGGVTVPELLPEIQELGRPPTSLLELIPRRELREGDQYSFLQQTVRDNQAAPVAIGELKPVSNYQLDMKTGRAEMIAHVSEPIPRVWLQDFRSLDQFLRDEMSYGLQLALQNQVLNGTGVSPQLLGMVPQLQPPTGPGDLIVLLRETIAQLESAGVTPDAVVMNNLDAAAIDLLQDQQGRYYGGGPFSMGPNTLWGLPRVSSAALQQGLAIVGDFRAVVIFSRGTVELAWSDNVGDSFQRNLIVFRCEGRFGLGLLKPFALKLVSAGQIGPTAQRATPPATQPTAPAPQPGPRPAGAVRRT